jgi:formylglycine-generating enzyme required for sulfatase activity
MIRRRAIISTLLLASAAAAAACSQPLPPRGQAIFFVDTDLGVPEYASRLRVDLYAEDGTWFESRDIGRSDPLDWPASFGVYSDDDTHDKRVLVRMRAYPEGAVRDYKGEKYAPRAPYTEPFVATSIADACARAPDLPIDGAPLTLRRGAVALTSQSSTGLCGATPVLAGGAVAARVVIAERGTYELDVATLSPFTSDAMLFLRRACDEASSEIACDYEARVAPNVTGHFPRFELPLEPGSYWVIAGGVVAGQPVDVTLEAHRVDMPVASEAPPTAQPTAPALPRVAHAPNEADVTPTSEPQPTATVDRLVLVRLRPGSIGAIHVTLHGACAGTMAKIGGADGAIDFAAAQTCVDTDGVRVPVAETPFDGDAVPQTSLQGTFPPADPCDAATNKDGTAVCVPGGIFRFGAELLAPGVGAAAPTPERIAVMSRFYLDRNEVTVGDVRVALTNGLAIDSSALGVNDEWLWVAPQNSNFDPFEHLCTYSTHPLGREDYPINCISWAGARAYCRARGGDLPTEAQWEYAMTAAGKPRKTSYPWGEDPAECDRAVFGRADLSGTILGPVGVCTQMGAKPFPHSVTTAPGDVTPLGILNLAGSMQEWMKDSWLAYDDPCWSAQSLRDPSCWEENAKYRSIRGASWVDDGINPGALRGGLAASVGTVVVPISDEERVWTGFRCAYEAAP